MPLPPIMSNYEVLPAVDGFPGPGIQAVSHDRLRPKRLSGCLELELEAVDRWRVGSGTVLAAARNREGRKEEILAEDLMLWQGKEPLLPGSSIKGTLRTLVESLTGGDWRSDDPEAEMSVASSLFGMVGQARTSFRGRVGFDDALPAAGSSLRLTIEDLPAPYEPRPQKRTGPRVYGASLGRQGNIPYLVVERGSRLRTRCMFQNLDEQELGLLARVMGLHERLCPRLGGGKFAGLGRMRFHLLGARLRTGPGRLSTLDAAQAQAALDGWMAAFPLDDKQRKVMDLLTRQMGAP